MSTPIYKISDRAPEFPCWLYEPHGLFPWRHYAEPAHDFGLKTHWTHSDTRPTVAPHAEPGSLAEIVHNSQQDLMRRGEAIRAQKNTQPSADVQRVAEELVHCVLASGHKETAISRSKSILRRFVAELTAAKDAEIARLKLACRVHHDDNGELKARAEKAEAELAEEAIINAKGSEREAKLLAERDQLRTQLDAWHSSFGTTQLSHASAERDAQQRTIAALRAIGITRPEGGK